MKSFGFFFIGAGTMLVGLLMIAYHFYIVINGVKTMGVVSNKYIRKGPDDDQTYLTVQYKVDGELIATDEHCDMGCAEVKIGDSLAITYLSSSPHDMVTPKEHSAIFGVLFAGMGGFLLLVGWHYYLRGDEEDDY